MTILRCTRKLLDRLAVPSDAESDLAPTNALGDWYANLVRFGREQFIVAVNERTALTLLLPAKDARNSLPPTFLRTLAWLLEHIAVPREIIDRELAAMQPLAYARTGSRSLVAKMNERAKTAVHLWHGGSSAMDIMVALSRFLVLSAQVDAVPRCAARMLLGLDASLPPPATVVRLHVQLEGLSPAIWRRLVVPEAIDLPQLHTAIQIAMGWSDHHLHEFEFGAARYGWRDPAFPIAGLREEEGMRLVDVLRATGADRFTYRYDLGDDWTHAVSVEAIEPNAEAIRGVVCTGGAQRCPPEDVGGPPGYLEFLQALRDPAHEGHRDALAWAGEPIDPPELDLVLVNALLRGEFGH